MSLGLFYFFLRLNEAFISLQTLSKLFGKGFEFRESLHKPYFCKDGKIATKYAY